MPTYVRHWLWASGEGAYLPKQDRSCPLRLVLREGCIYESLAATSHSRWGWHWLVKGIWARLPQHLPQEQSVGSGEREGLTLSREKKSGLSSFSWISAWTCQSWTEHATMSIHQKNVCFSLWSWLENYDPLSSSFPLGFLLHFNCDHLSKGNKEEGQVWW